MTKRPIAGRGAWILVLLLCPMGLFAQSDELLTRVLAGIKESQTKFKTTCGTVTETRSSKLMTKPMILRGKFCSEGGDRFMLEYAEPHAMSIRFNENYLNVTGGSGKTEVMNIGGDVRRGQSMFSGENSTENLKKNFDITAQESGREYELRLIPRTQGFRRKLNYLLVKLNKQDFLPRSLEVDGKSGVNSIFVIAITSTNKVLPDDTFRVTKTK